MNYFVAQIKYTEPVAGKDTVKKVTKGYLVNAESVTGAESKVQGWWPANWQDPLVKAVVTNRIEEVIMEGESETWWMVKVMYENPETGKWQAIMTLCNGGTPELALQRVRLKNPNCEIDEVKKYKVIIDEDLINDKN